MLPQPTLRHVADLTIKLDTIVEMGQGQGGTRRIIPIIGGQVSGPAFSGEIMNVGADWQTIFASGLAELDTRYAFRTDDGAVIEIRNFGYRHGPANVMQKVAAGEDVDPSQYYHAHACAPRNRASRLSMGQQHPFCRGGWPVEIKRDAVTLCCRLTALHAPACFGD